MERGRDRSLSKLGASRPFPAPVDADRVRGRDDVDEDHAQHAREEARDELPDAQHEVPQIEAGPVVHVRAHGDERVQVEPVDAVDDGVDHDPGPDLRVDPGPRGPRRAREQREARDEEREEEAHAGDDEHVRDGHAHEADGVGRARRREPDPEPLGPRLRLLELLGLVGDQIHVVDEAVLAHAVRHLAEPRDDHEQRVVHERERDDGGEHAAEEEVVRRVRRDVEPAVEDVVVVLDVAVPLRRVVRDDLRRGARRLALILRHGRGRVVARRVDEELRDRRRVEEGDGRVGDVRGRRLDRRHGAVDGVEDDVADGLAHLPAAVDHARPERL